MSVDQVRAAQQAVAVALFGNMQDDGWARVEAVYAEAADVGGGTAVAYDLQGRALPQPEPLGRGTWLLWAELRAVMTTPEDGAWLLARLALTPDGTFTYSFEWDRRPYLHAVDQDDWFAPGAPETDLFSDDEWRQDFIDHPRPAERVPAWARQLL